MKVNKQSFADLEKLLKKVRLTNKKDVDYINGIVDIYNYSLDLSKSLEKELKKFSFCEACNHFHKKVPFNKLYYDETIEADYTYYFEVCPICKNKEFVTKVEKDKICKS